MSRGKYSVLAFKDWGDGYEFKFNCYGMEPAPWNMELKAAGVEYDEKTMFGDYDEEGYDRYGYSAFDKDGNFVGLSRGVDRAGYTESDYLMERDLGEDQSYLW